MRRLFVKPQVMILVMLLTVAAPVIGAQQAVTVPMSDATRTQIEGFERSLRGAIDSAAGKLNERVRQAWPHVTLKLGYQTTPIVTGALVPEAGAVFHVLIPAISELDMAMASYMASRPVVRTADPNARVTNNLVVEPDPLRAAVPPLTDPNGEYTAFMRAALVDTLLDNALSLPVPAGQYLTVIADELLPQPANPFDGRSRTLILRLKAEDLVALRENRISRDEAKARIKESKYPN